MVAEDEVAEDDAYSGCNCAPPGRRGRGTSSGGARHLEGAASRSPQAASDRRGSNVVHSPSRGALNQHPPFLHKLSYIYISQKLEDA